MLASMELVFLVCKPMTLALPHRRCHLSPCRTAFRPADSQPRAVTMCFALQRPRVLLPNPAIVVMPLHKPISQAALPRCAGYLIGHERADRTSTRPSLLEYSQSHHCSSFACQAGAARLRALRLRRSMCLITVYALEPHSGGEAISSLLSSPCMHVEFLTVP